MPLNRSHHLRTLSPFVSSEYSRYDILKEKSEYSNLIEPMNVCVFDLYILWYQVKKKIFVIRQVHAKEQTCLLSSFIVIILKAA